MDAADVEIREARSDADEAAAATLMAAYLTWGAEQLGQEYGLEEAPANPSEVRASLGTYQPPLGRLLLAYWSDRAVGVGALRLLPDGAAEIKRMYVDPKARSCHLGSSLLDCLIDLAVQAGAEVIRLDTARFMSAAQSLYRSRGFIERPPYDGTEIPADLHEHWLFSNGPLNRPDQAKTGTNADRPRQRPADSAEAARGPRAAAYRRRPSGLLASTRP